MGDTPRTVATVLPRIRLDIILYRKGEYWIGHCLQLDVLTSGSDLNEVFADAEKVCAAQVLFALNHDKNLENLFRPPHSDLLRMMSMARVEGVLDLELVTEVKEHQPVQFHRLLAA